jgi:hypothetical protein
MRQRCAQFIVLLFPFLTGCLTSSADRSKWMDSFLPNPTDSESAYIEYVVIERPYNRDDINRQVWDRIDEQAIPFESRVVLEENGLRVGTISSTSPGTLRTLIDDPRTERGHRLRSFGLEKSASLPITNQLTKVDFMVRGEEETQQVAKENIRLGFQFSLRELPDGKVMVRVVPEGKCRTTKLLLPGADGDREHITDTFPLAAFEMPLESKHYLVIGTDSFKEHTLGHHVFTDRNDASRPIQRLLVISAGINKPQQLRPKQLNGRDDTTGALPLASQASVIRASGHGSK